LRDGAAGVNGRIGPLRDGRFLRRAVRSDFVVAFAASHDREREQQKMPEAGGSHGQTV
jgi:hypothetical protein